jgi:transposase
MNFLSKDRNQNNLIGYCLDDFVPKDAKCRLIVSLVKTLNLKRLYSRYSSQGNPAFEPSTMLATWFLAYCERETRTRKLEELCKRDLHFIYISSNLQPDHTSLSRFRKTNIDLMKEYFSQLVLLIKKKNSAEFKDIAIDGTKIQAASSKDNSLTEEGLSRELKRIHHQINDYLEECEINDDDSNTDVSKVRKKIKALKKKEQQLIQHDKELKKRKKKLKAEHRKNHRINITEPEAYVMNKVNGTQKLPGYNAQVSIDTKTQIIAANDVVQDRNDAHQFKQQHKNVEKNLGRDPDREYTTDSGYHSLQQLEYVKENQIKAIIADKSPKTRSQSKRVNQKDIVRKDKFDRSDFIYNKEKDYYQCPAAKKLVFIETTKIHGRRSRRYKCFDCDRCKYRLKCLPQKRRDNFRQIVRDEKEYLAEKMYQKSQTEYGKNKLIRRKYTIEGVFGNLKENLGFRRFRLKGLSSVQGEFNLMCIAHNINKIYILFIQLFSPDYYIRIFKERIIFNKIIYFKYSF